MSPTPALTAAKNASYAADVNETDPGASSFGFNPDPSLALPPDYMRVRQTIMDDPSLRLDFHWNESKAQQDSKQIDTSRYTDAAVLPLIQADMKRNQEHIDFVQSQMLEFQKSLDHPHPIRHLAKLDTADTIGLLASALMGGNIGHQAGQVMEHNQTVEDNAYANEVQQFGLDQRRGEQIVAAAQAELNRSLGHQQQLQGAEIQEVGHQADLRHGDIEKAKQRFQTASNPGEVDAAAAELAALGQPIPATAIADAKKAANIRYETEQRLGAKTAYDAVQKQIDQYGGFPDEASADNAQAYVDDIFNRYGVRYPAVRGGRTWKAQQDEAATKYKADHLKAEEAKWAKEAGIKDRELVGKLANWSSEAEYRRGQIQNAQDRNGIEALKKVNNAHLDQLTIARDKVQGELQSIQSELAGLKGNLAADRAKKKPLYAKQSALKARLDGYNYAIGRVQAQAGQDDSSGQQQPQQQSQPGAPPAGWTITK